LFAVFVFNSRMRITLMSKQKQSINESLRQLQEVVKWFEDQEEVDVEKGLEKVKQGTALVKDLKDRLKGVENEFKEVKQELEKIQSEEE